MGRCLDGVICEGVEDGGSGGVELQSRGAIGLEAARVDDGEEGVVEEEGEAGLLGVEGGDEVVEAVGDPHLPPAAA